MGTPRGRKVVTHYAKRVREAVVVKLAALIEESYPGVAPNTAYLRIQRATGVALATMQRIMSKDTGPSTDTLAILAAHLGTTVAELTAVPDEDRSVVPFPRAPTRRSKPPTPPT